MFEFIILLFLGLIKVSNYSLDKKLSDLVSQQQITNSNKKTDIYKVGILILSFIHGSLICDTNVDIPTTISPDMYDFLQK